MSTKSRLEAIRLLKENNVRASSPLVKVLTNALDKAFDEGYEACEIQKRLDTIFNRQNDNQ